MKIDIRGSSTRWSGFKNPAMIFTYRAFFSLLFDNNPSKCTLLPQESVLFEQVSFVSTPRNVTISTTPAMSYLA
jgi:hypothetical protein